MESTSTAPHSNSPQGCLYPSLQSDIESPAFQFGSNESTSIMARSSSSRIIHRRRQLGFLKAIARSINRGSPVCLLLPPAIQTQQCGRGNRQQRSSGGDGDNFRIIVSSSPANATSDFNPRPTYWTVHHLLLARLLQLLSNVPRPLSSSFVLAHDPITQNISPPPIAQAPSISSEVATIQSRYDALRQQDIWLTLLMHRLYSNSSGSSSSSRMLTDRHEQNRLVFEDILLLGQASLYHINNLHDRQDDMRLDVDNMSYEELLALEDRIGNVSIGLGEEMVLKCLTQSKCVFSNEKDVPRESCTICQEEYVEEDEAGILDCGHYFHVTCIKQWLGCKNICPICKSTALTT